MSIRDTTRRARTVQGHALLLLNFLARNVEDLLDPLREPR